MVDDFFYDDRPEAAIQVPRQGINVDAIRDSHAYKTARAEFRREAQARQSPCCICMERINYGLKWPHPDSWTLEHMKPIKHHPELVMDRNNWGSAHAACNRRKGYDDFAPIRPGDLGEPSEVW